MARWWEKLELQNPETKLPADVVDLVLTYEGMEYHSENTHLISTQDEAGEWVKPEFTLELRLKPDYPVSKKLYCSVLFFDGATGEVSTLSDTVLLTHKQGVREGQNNVVASFKLQEGLPYKLKVSPDLLDAGVFYVEDYLKLIVSEAEFDAEILDQKGNELMPIVSKGDSSNRFHSALQKILFNCEYRSLERSSVNDYSWQCHDVLVSVQHIENYNLSKGEEL